jgi:hypothetical protein
MTADFTVRTDFAQVEVDEQQVNLTRFNLFFPEKRDFFLEGQGTFAFAGRQSSGLGAGTGDTPYLFFSRRIGLDAGRSTPIDAGGRLTGKAGKVSIGALNVQTGEDPVTHVDAANFTVLRAKRDVLRRSSIGAMFTHRTTLVGRSGSNDGYGADATFSFSPEPSHGYLPCPHTHRRQGAGRSQLPRPLDYNGDKYGVQAERLEVGRNFNPEVGFVRRLDMRAQLRPAALQPTAQANTARAQVLVPGNPELHHQHHEPTGHARGGRPVSRASSPAATSPSHPTRRTSSGLSHPSRSLLASASRPANTTTTPRTWSTRAVQQRKGVGDDGRRNRHVLRRHADVGRL